MKKVLALLLTIIATLTVSSVAAYAEDMTSKAYLTKVAQEVKKKLELPKMVDEETKLVDIEAFDKEFQYDYILVNYKSKDLDSAKFIAIMKPQLKEAVCNNEKVKKQFLDKGVAVSYSYSGTDNKLIGKVSVTQEFCSK
jgi:uncharacterized protein YxeA